MKVKIGVEVKSDQLFVVDKLILNKLVVKSDLIGFRDAKTLVNAYHSDWFYNDQSYFSVPCVKIINGSIYFINGRHRFGVLSQYLNQIPIYYSGIYDDPFGKKIFLVKKHLNC